MTYPSNVWVTGTTPRFDVIVQVRRTDWEKCAHCGHSMTGSYLSVLKCSRCSSRHQLADKPMGHGRVKPSFLPEASR